MITLSTLTISAFVALAVSLAAAKMIKDRKEGKHSCGGNCPNCPCGGCHEGK